MITLFVLGGGASVNGVLARFAAVIGRKWELMTSYHAETFAFVVLGAASCELFEVGARLVKGFNLSVTERVVSLELEPWSIRFRELCSQTHLTHIFVLLLTPSSLGLATLGFHHV